MKIANGMLLFHNKAEIYSNWYLRPVTIKGVMFNCLEQYLMFAKAKLFGDEVRAEEIMATPDPTEQKAIGRKVEGYVDAIWIVRRGTILWHGVYAKFTQHEDLKAELLGTDDLLLVEASGSDRVYGIGMWETNPRIYDKRNWLGQNLLGEDLMSARSLIRKEVSDGTPHRKYD